jgi:glyoxylase I family protein
MIMELQNIHHVAIIVSDYQVSKRFYTEILGFSVIQETCRQERESYKLDLRVGDRYQIELFSFPNPPKRINHPEACGLRHLAFSTDNLESVYTELMAKEVAVENIRTDEVTGKRFFFCVDPDGLPLEFYEY